MNYLDLSHLIAFLLGVALSAMVKGFLAQAKAKI